MTGLKKNRDFSAVYQSGRSAADRYLVLYVLPGSGNESRIGISVSKKVGNSVVRHRIKRRIKEIARIEEDALPQMSDMVVIARRPCAEADFWQIRRSLLKLAKRLSRGT